jgi:hypothetical protein
VPNVERAVAATRAALARGVDPAKLGQPTLLPHRADAMSTDLIVRDFGAAFSEQLAKLPLGEWTGPVASGMGAHLVRVSARTPAEMPPISAVRQQASRELENERRERSRAESYRKLRESYTVVIESNLPKVAVRQ